MKETKFIVNKITIDLSVKTIKIGRTPPKRATMIY